TGIDTSRQEVSFKLLGTDRDQVLPYEHLVLALGSITKMPRLPGLAEWGLQIKTLMDAIALRDRTISLLEMADATPSVEERRALLHMIIVGANFTGVELAGELQYFLHEAVRRYKNLTPDDCRVTLIEITDRILPALDPDLASYAAQRLEG